MTQDFTRSEPSPPLPPDVNRGYTLNVVLWVTGGLSTLLVILRVYTRFVVIKAPGWDDAVVVVSALTNLVGRALVSVSIAYGVGRHAVYLSPEDLHQAAYYTLINPVFGIVAVWLPKLAVAMLIISLSGPLRRGVWVLYPVLAVSTVPALLGTIFTFTQCVEPGSTMHFFSPPACVAPRVWSVTAVVASVAAAFSDLVLAFYPITLLWNLQMKRTRKITVISVMAFGFFAFIATIVKATALEGEHAQDLTYGIFWITITLYIQADLVIAAACAPAILKLWLSNFGIHEAPAAVFPLDQHGKPIPESQAELERDQPVLSERGWSTSDSRDELV